MASTLVAVDTTVKPLTDVETAWVAQQLGAAGQFAQDYCGQRQLTGLAALDHAWASWLDRQAVDPEDPNTVINAVGVSLGQAVVDTLEGFSWVIAEDANGTDLAVFGEADQRSSSGEAAQRGSSGEADQRSPGGGADQRSSSGEADQRGSGGEADQRGSVGRAEQPGAAGQPGPGGQPGPKDVLIYPANLVAKRYEKREATFLVAIHAAIVQQVRDLPA
jgi:hypothetical protein